MKCNFCEAEFSPKTAWQEYCSRECQKLKARYNTHKSSAKIRGIGFKLTYDEWISIWQASGHLHERGRGKNKYVMARFRDKGAYKAGNVEIVESTKNVLDRRYKHSDAAKAKISKSWIKRKSKRD